MQKSTLFSLLVGVVVSVQLAYGQWPADSTSNVKICQAANDQKYPEMTTDGAGGAIIVWEDQRAASQRIYAQRVDSSGVVKWTTNGVLISSADNSQLPQIVSDGAGGAIITWFDLRYGWPKAVVAAQRVNRNGDTLWKANGVLVASAASSWPYPKMASYGTAGALITWIGVNGEVYANKIDTSGALLWTPGGVLVAHEGSEPRIVVDGAGGAILAWYNYEETHSYTKVYGGQVNAAGTRLSDTAGIRLCAADLWQGHPQLTADGNGGAIIAWLDGRADVTNNVYAQHLGSSGGVHWTANGIQISTVQAYSNVQVASDGQGGAFIAFMGTMAADIFLQRVNGSGIVQWGSDLRLTDNTSPSLPRMISDGVTGAFVAWEGTGLGKFKLQHAKSNGTFSFQADGKTVAVNTVATTYFALATDGKGRTIVAWENMPAYTTDIVAHRATVSGFVTGVSEQDGPGGIPSAFVLDQNYPNPFNPTTGIRYQVSGVRYGATSVTIKIFDLLGREVATLVNEVKQPGTYEVRFDGRGLASGIYLCRMEAGGFVSTRKLVLLR